MMGKGEEELLRWNLGINTRRDIGFGVDISIRFQELGGLGDASGLGRWLNHSRRPMCLCL